MKANLQYAPAAAGPFKNCGLIRSKDKLYVVKRFSLEDRLGIPQPAGFTIEARTKVLQLNTDFLTQRIWHFRLNFFDNSQVAYLGQYPYLISYDAQLERNSVEYHEIRVQFDVLTGPANIPFSHRIYLSDLAIFL